MACGAGEAEVDTAPPGIQRTGGLLAHSKERWMTVEEQDRQYWGTS